jgi:hypothetical protein
MNTHLVTAGVAALMLTASAHGAPLTHDLAGLSFLLGEWSGGEGKVAEAGGTSKGSSVITAQAGGSVLLRRDHTSLFDAGGKPAGEFEQVMMIYPEAGQIHAEYADGAHIIHYTSASIDPGHSVTFSGAARPGAPIFKLTYTLRDAHTLSVAFAMVPPGTTTPHPIAIGFLKRQQ